MANKIRETLNLIQSGGRSNKYRILLNFFSPGDLDILCHATSMPGREVGTVEVYMKGRKFQLAGERTDSGEWEMTMYNTPDLAHRRFFLKVLAGIQNFNEPASMGNDLNIEDLYRGNTALNYSSNSPSADGRGSIGGFFGAIGNVVNQVSAVQTKIDEAYREIRSGYQSIKNIGQNLKDFVDGNDAYGTTAAGLGEVHKGASGYSSMPWYQQDIVIQQLNHNDEPISETILHNAFITSVGPVEYDDSTEGISTTNLVFAYTGISIGDNYNMAINERY